eukprot:gb/GEZN01003373.1/.p1 GENE.gb/GEZN01003373.1/~~gb/GEZN01003373.1/.p1  ORF type:complete len:709 (+),score=65.39 gb/GEZN01003373.1/:48-2174(+)
MSTPQAWIHKQLALRKQEFCDKQKLTIRICSWNVNAKKPHKEKDLSPWVGDGNADIYVFGFQEIVDLNAGNMILDHNASAPWEARIQKLLHKQHKHHKIATVNLVGLSIIVYVKGALLQYITDVQSDSIGVGILGVGGNKGATVVRFELWNSKLCFINTHLAAHQNHVKQRNRDYREITRRLRFVDAEGGKTVRCWDHDALFWLGDLNYRLNFASVMHVDDRIHLKDWPHLLSHDQLTVERENKRAFAGFKEGEVTFPPTYKYQSGTNDYERRPEKKIRMPAWTDRIQWIGSNVEQLSYTRAELLISDHKPVCSDFSYLAMREDLEKKLQLFETLMPIASTQPAPILQLSSQEVMFPSVHFGQEYNSTLQIRNVGHAVAQVRITGSSDKIRVEEWKDTDVRQSLLDSQRPMGLKTWLHLTPAGGAIAPGQSLTLAIKILVTRVDAQPLNLGWEQLHDVFTLQVKHGQPSLVTVLGTYERSLLGCDLAVLNSLNGSSAEALVATTEVGQPVAPLYPLSSAVVRLVEAFVKLQGLTTWNSVLSKDVKSFSSPHPFQPSTPQLDDEVWGIHRCLALRQRFPSHLSLEGVTLALLQFLDSFPEPLLPPSLALPFYPSMHISDWCRHVLLVLKLEQYSLVVYLLSFLRALVANHAIHKMQHGTVAYPFSRALTHLLPEGTFNEFQPQSPFMVLRHLLSVDFQSHSTPAASEPT